MPIIIDEISGQTGQPDPADDLASRVARLEARLAQCETANRHLRDYCHNLEEACRTAFGQVPGVTPFPSVHR